MPPSLHDVERSPLTGWELYYEFYRTLFVSKTTYYRLLIHLY